MIAKATVVQVLLLLALGLVMPAPASEVTITTIGRELESLDFSEEVRHFSFETGDEVELIKVGQELPVGDEVVALSDDLFVELTCPEGSQLRFTGNFRLQINLAADGQDCAIDSRDGSLDVLTESEVETCSAGVCAATGGTRYAVRLERSAGKLERTITVFEGDVEVVSRGHREQVTTKNSLRVSDAAEGGGALSYQRQEVSARQVDRWAGLYARFDVVAAQAAGVALSAEARGAAQVEFKHLHAQVLKEPEAKEPRAQLAAKQVTYKVDRAALYNATRSGLVTKEQVEERQIDAGSLRPGSGANHQQLEVLIRDQSVASGLHSRATVTPTIVRGLTLNYSPLDLAPPSGSSRAEAARYWRRQLEAYEGYRERGELNARRYLTAARAHKELGDPRAAAAMAKRALRLHASDETLNEREKSYALELARGG